jgi:BMFP domain-containing protein YqiC
MDKKEIDAIRARCDAATPVPWKGSAAEFYEHARQDIPALLAALDEAEKGESDAVEVAYQTGQLSKNLLKRATQAEAERDVLAEYLAEKAREETRQGTHSDNCHLWGAAHYNCLMRKYTELQEQLEKLIKKERSKWDNVFKDTHND